jgi:hypothetical protein
VDVGVDDGRDRLIGDRLHLRQDRFPVVGQLGVNEDDAIGGNEDGRIAAGAANLVEVGLDLFDRASWRNPRPRPTSASTSALLRRDTGNGHAGHDDSGQKSSTSHQMPPGQEYRNLDTRQILACRVSS